MDNRKKYSQLNVMQKINAKANRVAANERWNIVVGEWMPNYMFESSCPMPDYDYNSPFNFRMRFPKKGPRCYKIDKG